MSHADSAHITCPHCWQPLDVALDVSVPEQTLIQDCEVCCNPYELTYSVIDGVPEVLEVRSLEQ